MCFAFLCVCEAVDAARAWPRVAALGRARVYQKARLLARYGHACLSADRCAIGPCILRMRAVMHEKRFALHGHKSTDGLNVEEEIGETTVVGIYVCTI